MESKFYELEQEIIQLKNRYTQLIINNDELNTKILELNSTIKFLENNLFELEKNVNNLNFREILLNDSLFQPLKTKKKKWYKFWKRNI